MSSDVNPELYLHEACRWAVESFGKIQRQPHQRAYHVVFEDSNGLLVQVTVEPYIAGYPITRDRAFEVDPVSVSKVPEPTPIRFREFL
jgi:hypothetical protein